MNKNMIFAFTLVLSIFLLFNSPFYAKIYEKIFNKKPFSAVEKRSSPERTDFEESAFSSDSAAATIEKNQPTTLSAQQTDTASSLGTNDTLWIHSQKLIYGIESRGAKVFSIKTKEYSYTKSNKDSLVELLANTQRGISNLSINDFSYDNQFFSCSDTSGSYHLDSLDSMTITFFVPDESIGKLTKKFTFYGNRYSFDLSVSSNSLPGRKLTIGCLSGITESEFRNNKNPLNINRMIHLNSTDNIEHINEKKGGQKESAGYYEWAALSSKYFLIAMIPARARHSEVSIEATEHLLNPDKEASKKQDKYINYAFSMKSSCEESIDTYSFYTGPSKIEELKKQKVGLQKVLFQGSRIFLFADVWFPPLCEVVLSFLLFLQKGLFDYGIVIIVLTIILKVLTFPLAQSSMKSMMRMNELKPKIDHIRQKYKANPQKINEQLMQLYKKEGINPLNPGCLPIVIQIPIFFSLYIVLNKAIELRGATTILLPWIQDLSQAETLFTLPFKIVGYGDNFALLPIANAILTFFQNKATIKDPNQKMMIYFLPIFLLVIFNSFPSGLVLYWTFQSFLQLMQQMLLSKKTKVATR